MMDAVGRLFPGVLGDESSSVEESFSQGLLEYPQYTRPEVFEGTGVPEVLTSGDHARIERWRRRESLRRTLLRRPELLETALLTDEDQLILEELKAKR
jgi:tRNA (guanine37-N1)-methyltransferase